MTDHFKPEFIFTSCGIASSSSPYILIRNDVVFTVQAVNPGLLPHKYVKPVSLHTTCPVCVLQNRNHIFICIFTDIPAVRKSVEPQWSDVRLLEKLHSSKSYISGSSGKHGFFSLRKFEGTKPSVVLNYYFLLGWLIFIL